jgi:hypothetical protein
MATTHHVQLSESHRLNDAAERSLEERIMWRYAADEVRKAHEFVESAKREAAAKKAACEPWPGCFNDKVRKIKGYEFDEATLPASTIKNKPPQAAVEQRRGGIIADFLRKISDAAGRATDTESFLAAVRRIVGVDDDHVADDNPDEIMESFAGDRFPRSRESFLREIHGSGGEFRPQRGR